MSKHYLFALSFFILVLLGSVESSWGNKGIDNRRSTRLFDIRETDGFIIVNENNFSEQRKDQAKQTQQVPEVPQQPRPEPQTQTPHLDLIPTDIFDKKTPEPAKPQSPETSVPKPQDPKKSENQEKKVDQQQAPPKNEGDKHPSDPKDKPSKDPQTPKKSGKNNKKVHMIKIYGNDRLQYYYMNMMVGEPPQQQSLIIDTGSETAAFPCSRH